MSFFFFVYIHVTMETAAAVTTTSKCIECMNITMLT